jgi:spermidine synthase
MPQRWYFFYGIPTLRFELDASDDGDDDDDGKVLHTSWNQKLASLQQTDAIRQFFLHELRRLERLKKRIDGLDTIKDQMPANEWNVIWQYFDAIVNAMTHGLQSLGGSKGEICATTDDDGANPCSHYVDPASVDDDLPYTLSNTCQNNYPDGYSLVETVVVLNNSRTIDFREKPGIKEDDDDNDEAICLFQNDELVVCPSFRPHVYEPLVHFPAQFLDAVERVLILGGGNAMSLYEVLKYTSVERVVVMEEHQQVTRKSFEYFQTTPYFDDERVEWWFGPMDLSLLFGGHAFDLVIVENADFGADETILEALACLLDEGGVVAGYGTDMASLSRVFKYSTQAVFDEPALCKYESMVLASHQVDFLQTRLWDHDVDTFVFEPIEDSSGLLGLLLNYNKNSHRTQMVCLPSKNGYEIMEIIEMQGVEMSKIIQTTLRDSLSLHGYEVSSRPFENSEGLFDVVLEEAYLTVKASPGGGHVGLDIHMWNSTYEKIEHLRQIAVDVLEPKKYSSFRLLPSDGLFDDNDECSAQGTFATMVDKNLSTRATNKEMNEFELGTTSSVYGNPYLKLQDNHIGVLCGKKDAQECHSYSVLANVSKSGSVSPFWTCPELDEEAQNIEDLRRAMLACERRLTKQLDNETRQLYALIVDQSAGPLMLQVFDSMLSSAANRMKWFESSHLFLSLSFDDKTNPSRRAFLDRIRQYLREDPVARADYVIESETADVELGIVLSGLRDPFSIFLTFQKEMLESVGAIDELSTSSVDLRHVAGGTMPLEQIVDPHTIDSEGYVYDQGEAARLGVLYGYQTVFRLQMLEPWRVCTMTWIWILCRKVGLCKAAIVQ